MSAQSEPTRTRTLKPVEAPPEEEKKRSSSRRSSTSTTPSTTTPTTTSSTDETTVASPTTDTSTSETTLGAASSEEETTTDDDVTAQLTQAMSDPSAAAEIGLDMEALQECYDLAQQDLSRFPSRVHVTIKFNSGGTVDKAKLKPHGIHPPSENCALKVIGGIHLPERTDGKSVEATVPINMDKLRE